jgi:flagellar protein FliS
VADRSKAAYLRTQVLTARPEQLTLMLLDGAIRFADQGRSYIDEKRFDRSCDALARAQNIMIALLNGLRPEKAPEICRRQAGLYLFVYKQLVLGNAHRNPQPIADALRILAILRQTWLDLMLQLQAQHAAGDPQPAAPAPVALSIQG